MKRRASHRVPASYFADAPALSAESENRGRSAAHTAGAARREAAGESDSAGIFAAPMIAAKGEQKQAAGGGVGFAAASIASQAKGAVR